MTREEIQAVLTSPDIDYLWLGYSLSGDRESSTFTCVRVGEFDTDNGVLTFDGDRELKLDHIIFAKCIDPDVWSGVRSRRDEDVSGFTLKGTMMSQSGEIAVKGQITSVDQTHGTVHFESDFMLSDITELIIHYKGDD